MNPLSFIKSKVVEAVPEIMEPTFGCELEWKGNKGRWRDNYKKGFRNIGGEVYADVWDDFYGLSMWPIDEIKVLGRPILAQDVLQLLPFPWILKGGTNGGYEFVNVENFGTKKFKNEYILWSKGSLTDQNERTLERIANLLK